MAAWYELDVTVAPGSDEIASGILFDAGSVGIESESVNARTRIRAYFHDAPDEAAVRNALQNFCGELDHLALRVMETDEIDWSENWKLHFAPLAVGDSLFVCPPWAPEAPTGRIPIVINPGMAFGTGQHATTRGCMLLIEEACRGRHIERAADIGTGSGILAIVLAKLGSASVSAIDNDPVALATASENIERNPTVRHIHLGSSLSDVIGPCDIIVANLFADLLIDLRDGITALGTPRARLICSGMLESDVERVITHFGRVGWQPHARHVESPWCSIAFDRIQS